MMNNHLWAENITPPNPLNSVTLSARVLERTFENSHYRIIGSCLWMQGFPPRAEPGVAIEQFLPDLVVTVSNQTGANPWKEIALVYENKAALKGYQSTFIATVGLPFDHGDGSSQSL